MQLVNSFRISLSQLEHEALENILASDSHYFYESVLRAVWVLNSSKPHSQLLRAEFRRQYTRSPSFPSPIYAHGIPSREYLCSVLLFLWYIMYIQTNIVHLIFYL